jgi:agmatine deiminase
MIKRIPLLISITSLLALGCIAQAMRMPAEWEPQERVMVTWTGQERRDPVSLEIIRALQPHVKVTINVVSEEIKAGAIKLLGEQKIDMSNIDFVVDPGIDFWLRDYAVFVKDAKGQVNVVDFAWSAYGSFPQLEGRPLSERQAILGQWEQRLAKQLNIPVIKSEQFFEGGGIESNGRGTLMIIKDMAVQRNPGKSIAEMEAELKRTLGARKVIWLEKGLIEDKRFRNWGPFHKNYFGGGANMHVDELARFVNETTVLLPYISPEDREKSPVDNLNYPMLEENFRILSSATTADGKKLNVVRVPMPEIEELKLAVTLTDTNVRNYELHGFKKGDTVYQIPAASYANYLITNNVVLIPKYWKEGMPESQKRKDDEARQAFAKVFPGRKVIQIYTLDINRGGGGIHCATRDIPASK